MGIARAVVVVVVVFAGLLANPSIALAGREWCDEDPIFVVGSSAFHATSSWPSGLTVSGVSYTLAVPSNVHATVHLPSSGIPVTVQLSRTLGAWDGTGAVPAMLQVTLRAPGVSAVRVSVNGMAWAYATSTTNTTITLRLAIAPGEPAPRHSVERG